ncbi:toxin-activating lysine-acyltransferase [Vibrio atypicus]|uniref:toxin-activating lysine-acyltransferase n=1 Tax=Vibrio atypicus TaxID=558271 RepID=UPI00135A67AE|nr:toxin-activating lysine-acyltransferase [Vibrio atypicus]
MGTDNFYRNLGHCFHLLAHSNAHQKFNLAGYMDVEICPANWRGQLRVYENHHKQPVGFVTWAKVSKSTKQELIEDSRALYYHEWNNGDCLFFNDFVAPWGGVKEILSDLTSTVFPKEQAFSIGRDKKGNTKKVHRWTGKEYTSQ